MSRVDEVLREYRQRLLARDAAAQVEYTRRWLRVEQALEAQYLNLAMDAAEAGTATVEQVYALQRYQALLVQAKEETRRFTLTVADRIAAEQTAAASDGLDMATDAIAAQFARVGVEASFTILPLDAIRAMIGITADGTPLAQLLMASYPETINLLTQALVNALALGYNPRKTARMMAEAMSGNLQRAFLVARTEQMRAFRSAQVQEYRESGVVRGYRRRAALSGRTCLACLMEDGKFYDTLEQYSDHPGGRCSAEPVLMYYHTNPAKTGREWFESLTADKQREIMGEGHFRAWKDGAFSLDAVSRIHNHPTWGESPQVVPLKELLNA